MTNIKSMISLFAAALMAVSTAFGQQSGYCIYPTPQRQEMTAGSADFTHQVNLVAERGIDEATVNRAISILKDHGLKALPSNKAAKGCSNLILGIEGSDGAADRECRKRQLRRDIFSFEKYDRHILSLTADRGGAAQVLILGENTDATFCGLASLEQILDNGTENLPCVTLYDFADVRDRGIIEGYYGVPYSAAVTKDLFRYMARYKLNTYMYGAKSDPYHSFHWADPYPESITPEQEKTGLLSRDMLKGITDVAHSTKVNFIWAIHPGQAFIDAGDKNVNDRIMSKLENMYELGVRQFGVFVDDVGVPYDEPTQKLSADRLTELQGQIDARWNTPGAAPSDTVKPLNFVPQLYAYSWTTPDKAGAFFKSLKDVPSKVNIYITGNAIWTVPNNHDLQVIKGWMGRTPGWWWNYPCNDNDMTKLFTMDMYSNFKDESFIETLSETQDGLETRTVIINPMQQGEVSKIALFSVADYTWNNNAFDNNRSWNAALSSIAGPEYAPALKTLAPVLRYYDADALGYYVKEYKRTVAEGKPRPQNMINKLTSIISACGKVKELETSPDESDRLLYEDLRPWLLRLEAMSHETVSLLKGEKHEPVDYGKCPDFKFQVLNGMGEGISLFVKTAEPAAEVLAPFIQWLRDRSEPVLDMLVGTYTKGNASQGTYLMKFNQLDASFSITDTAFANNPSFMTVSDDRRFIYSVGEASDGSQCAYSYSYGGDGISVLNSQPTDGEASGAAPCNIILVNGSIITSNYTGGTVSAFPVRPDGTLGPMSQQFIPDVPKGVTPHMHCAVLSPDGEYLFVTDLGSDAIYRFTVGDQETPLQDGITAWQFDRSTHPGPRHMIFSEDGKYAYLIHELGDLLTVFRYDDGRLEHISTQEAYSGNGKGSADIHLSPDGRFLYTSHRLKEDGISIFSVNRKKGTVRNIGYCRTGVHPRNFAITPNGEWLLCACRDSNCIEIYSIDKEDGSLAFTGKTIDIPAPVCVRFVR